MNRNVNSHFAVNPTSLDMPRSRFDRDSTVKLTFNVGECIPFYCDPVLPGDSFEIDTSKVVRLQTMITPMMDNIYLDTYYFFVPSRLCWNHWKEFMGENTQSAWIPQVEYSEPYVVSPEGGFDIGTIADYMGIPTGVGGLEVTALPFRAYSLIMNEWFRDQNLTDPLNIPMDDSTTTGSNGSNYITDCALGGKPFIASKFFDMFTGALPSPQKGPDVTIPIGATGPTPVMALDQVIPFGDLAHDSNGNFVPMYAGTIAKNGHTTSNPYGQNSGYWSGTNVTQASLNPISSLATNVSGFTPVNLYAMTSGQEMASINQLRLAFQIQKFYEASARGGSRYIELLKSMFGVTSPDARLQRPEYLGGNRVPINVNQVIQQSETATTPQGNVTGMSLTTDVHSDFTKSFVEHGYVIGIMVARYNHTYQQGLERFWSRRTRFDYYWPVFANIGEQAIKNKEIYAQGTPEDDEVFGYQEAWAEYRYKPSRVAGEMRSQYAQSLDVWHLADYYSELPRLSDAWIREDKINVDRVLAVTSEVSNQLFADIYVKNTAVRCMPMYSIPGLIDHH